VVVLNEARDDTDTALVEACRQGDTNAFSEVVRRYKNRVYNVIYRFLGNHEDAVEVAQEVFVRAYRSIDRFHGEAKLYTWLYTIAANLSRNRLRDRARKGRNMGVSLEVLEEEAPGAAQTAASTPTSPRSLAERRELDEALQRCLDRLGETHRLAFVLRVFDGLSYEEIAESIGCPQGTVKSRLNQARKSLAECLKRSGVL